MQSLHKQVSFTGLALLVGVAKARRSETSNCETQLVRITCSGPSFSTFVNLQKSMIAGPKVSSIR